MRDREFSELIRGLEREYRRVRMLTWLVRGFLAGLLPAALFPLALLLGADLNGSWYAVAGAPFLLSVLGAAGGWFWPLSGRRVVVCADGNLDAEERLITAHQWIQEGRGGPFRELLLHDAASFLERTDPRRAFPLNPGPEVRYLVIVALVAVLAGAAHWMPVGMDMPQVMRSEQQPGAGGDEVGRDDWASRALERGRDEPEPETVPGEEDGDTHPSADAPEHGAPPEEGTVSEGAGVHRGDAEVGVDEGIERRLEFSEAEDETPADQHHFYREGDDSRPDESLALIPDDEALPGEEGPGGELPFAPDEGEDEEPHGREEQQALIPDTRPDPDRDPGVEEDPGGDDAVTEDGEHPAEEGDEVGDRGAPDPDGENGVEDGVQESVPGEEPVDPETPSDPPLGNGEDGEQTADPDENGEHGEHGAGTAPGDGLEGEPDPSWREPEPRPRYYLTRINPETGEEERIAFSLDDYSVPDGEAVLDALGGRRPFTARADLLDLPGMEGIPGAYREVIRDYFSLMALEAD